jgi:hypothetical protein
VRGDPCTLSQDRQKPVKAPRNSSPRRKGGRPRLNWSESELRQVHECRNQMRRQRYDQKKQANTRGRLAEEEREEDTLGLRSRFQIRAPSYHHHQRVAAGQPKREGVRSSCADDVKVKVE